MAAEPKLAKIWFQLSCRFRGVQGLNHTKFFVYESFYYVCSDRFIYRVNSRGRISDIVRADCAVVDFFVSGCKNQDDIEDVFLLLGDGFVCATQIELKTRCDEGSCEIFDDLLSSPTTSVPVPQRSPSTINIHSDLHHAKVTGAQRILVTNHHVCVLSENETSRQLVVYGRDALQETEQCQPLATYSIGCCRVSGFPGGEHDPGASRADPCPDGGATKLVCLTAFPQGYDVAVTPYTCLLHKVLYNHMFGLECNLLSTPGIVVGTSQGQLYAVPVKAHGQSKSPWKLICDMAQPVCSIHALTFPNNNTNLPSETCCDCLMIIGNKGKMMTLTCSAQDTVEFREVFLAGPVRCSTLDDVNLIYSTGTHIHVVELTDIAQAPEKRVVKSIELAYQNITSLVVASKDDVSSTKCISVMAAVSLGHVLHITHDLWGNDLMLPTPAGPTGSQLKDLLTAIGQNAESHIKLKSVISEQQTALAQLAWAALVVTQGVKSSINRSKHKQSKSDQSKPVLTCTAFVESRDFSYKRTTSLVIELVNQSQHTPSKGWTFVVCVASKVIQEHSISRNFQRSVPLDNLSSGGIRQILFELPTSITRDTPLLVQPSVVYHISAGNLSTENFMPQNSSDVVAVPLPSVLVDILHFLLPSSNASGQTIKPTFSAMGLMSSSDQHTLNSVVTKIAAQRPMARVQEKPLVTAHTTSQSLFHSVIIQVPESQYRMLFGKEFDGERVLSHVLRDSQAISVPPGATSIHASSPEDHQVSLHVSQDSSELGCSIQVSSADVVTLCQLSDAIRQRILVDCGSTNNSCRVSSLILRKCLNSILDFQHEVTSLQASLQEGNTDVLQVQRQTLALYEKMRKLHLPS